VRACGDGPRIATKLWGIAPPHMLKSAGREIAQNATHPLDRICNAQRWLLDPFRVTVNPDDDALSESARFSRNTLRTAYAPSNNGPRGNPLRRKVVCAGGLRKVLRTLPTECDRQKMLAAHGAWVSTSASPSRSRAPQLQSVVAAYFSHSEDNKLGSATYNRGHGREVALDLSHRGYRGGPQARKTHGRQFHSHRETIREKETYLAFGRYGDAVAAPQNSSYSKRNQSSYSEGHSRCPAVWGGWLGQ